MSVESVSPVKCACLWNAGCLIEYSKPMQGKESNTGTDLTNYVGMPGPSSQSSFLAPLLSGRSSRAGIKEPFHIYGQAKRPPAC